MSEPDFFPLYLRLASLAGLVCLALLALVAVAVVLAAVNAARARRRRPAVAPPGPRGPGGWTPLPVASRRTSPAAAPEGHCPECGTRLPEDSPDGLCPQCLLQGGLDPASAEGLPRTTPYPGPVPAPTPAELAGRFPQLEVLELIGQGGMGAVYKARQTKLDRLVALKVLPPAGGADPAFAERFAREARTLAKLNHPHVIAVYDFGESAGLYYLVMEYVDGPNLREVLRAGRLQPEQALALVPQICEALQYAHDEGVVHRDIKPENILLDRKGRVKIADFGLAKLLNRPRAEFTLTGSRQVMGTLDYMAPEQRHSPLAIDHRADIYSLGVVFYEMLTGELPLGRFAPPSEKAPVDARLDGVVLRALEQEPERRYQSVSEVQTDVATIAGVQGRAEPAVGEQGRERKLTVALRLVRGPATGLLLGGILCPLCWAVALVVLALLDPVWLHDVHPWKVDPHWLAPLDTPVVPIPAVIYLLISLALGGILVAAAVKMRQCEAYELALIACVIALLPISTLAWPFTLPMGLWTLLVLVKESVRAGFASQLERGDTGATAMPRPTGPVRRRARGFLRSVWALLFARQP